MAKAKKPIIEKNFERFINNNFDKRDRRKEESVKFEWFVNSMHIWHCSSQIFNSNSKIGKDISLGTAQGGDAFFMSIGDMEKIFTLNDNIEDIISYIVAHKKPITFHFIQTKKSESAKWSDFLNFVEVPLKIWNGQEFSNSQPTLVKLQEFVDAVTDEEDTILGKIKHKIQIYFYTNKDDSHLESLERDWKKDIETKIKGFEHFFGPGTPEDKNVKIILRGAGFLNNIYEKINSNTYSLIVNKREVIEAGEKKYLIGYITAKELLDCIAPATNGYRILYSDVFKNNIRLYLGGTTVNQKIEETLSLEPKKFHFYNNGLTITTKEIKDSENSKNFVITSVNIVNGCQTANSIYNIFKSDQSNEKDVKIPVKIIVAQDKEYEDITIRTNTQNGLEAKDLISITTIQKELEEEFKKVKFLGKVFFYKRQKSNDADNNDADFILQIDDILRAVFSTIMLIPNKVTGYYDQTTLKFVDRIFDERFSKLYTIVTALNKLVENQIEESYPDYKRLKYHLTYLIYRYVNKGESINSFESYFRDRDNIDLSANEIETQNQLINKVYSNIYSILKSQDSFDKILNYILAKIKDSYPELIDLSTKEKEKILYKPVEKLPRIRSTPIFQNFKEVFKENSEEVILENTTDVINS